MLKFRRLALPIEHSWFDHLFSLSPSYRAIIGATMRRTPSARLSKGL